MNTHALSLAALLLLLLAPIGCAESDSTVGMNEEDAITAAPTSGTDSLFDLAVTSLTAAKARTQFHAQSAALGDWVMGMRTRPCEKGTPDVCGDWTASTTAVIPLNPNAGIAGDFLPITEPGATSIAFKSVSGAALYPVVAGTITLVGDGHIGSQGKPVYVSFSAGIGSSATLSYFTDGARFSTGIAATQPTAMDASRYVARIGPMKAAPAADGSYEQRELVVYARVKANEKSVLRAEGADLLVDWCTMDAGGACTP